MQAKAPSQRFFSNYGAGKGANLIVQISRAKPPNRVSNSVATGERRLGTVESRDKGSPGPYQNPLLSGSLHLTRSLAKTAGQPSFQPPAKSLKLEQGGLYTDKARMQGENRLVQIAR